MRQIRYIFTLFYLNIRKLWHSFQGLKPRNCFYNWKQKWIYFNYIYVLLRIYLKYTLRTIKTKNPCFPCFHTTEHDRNFLKNDISGEGSSNYEEHNLFTFNLAHSLPFRIFFSYKEIRFDIVRYEILSLLFCGDHFNSLLLNFLRCLATRIGDGQSMTQMSGNAVSSPHFSVALSKTADLFQPLKRSYRSHWPLKCLCVLSSWIYDVSNHPLQDFLSDIALDW